MGGSGDTVTVRFPKGRGQPRTYKLRTLDKDGNTVREKFEAGSTGTILASEAALYPDLEPIKGPSKGTASGSGSKGPSKGGGASS